MKRFLKFLGNRLSEVSTWRGIIALLTLVGVSLTPEQTESFITAGIALWAALEAFLPDPAGRIPDRVQSERVREDVQLASKGQGSVPSGTGTERSHGEGNSHLGDFGSDS